MLDLDEGSVSARRSLTRSTCTTPPLADTPEDMSKGKEGSDCTCWRAPSENVVANEEGEDLDSSSRDLVRIRSQMYTLSCELRRRLEEVQEQVEARKEQLEARQELEEHTEQDTEERPEVRGPEKRGVAGLSNASQLPESTGSSAADETAVLVPHSGRSSLSSRSGLKGCLKAQSKTDDVTTVPTPTLLPRAVLWPACETGSHLLAPSILPSSALTPVRGNVTCSPTCQEARSVSASKSLANPGALVLVKGQMAAVLTVDFGKSAYKVRMAHDGSIRMVRSKHVRHHLAATLEGVEEEDEEKQ